MKISFDDPDGELAMGAAKISKTKKCQMVQSKIFHLITNSRSYYVSLSQMIPTNKPVHTHHA